MLLFRCTAKAAKSLRQRGLREAESPPAGSWFVNFRRFARRGYLLFTHEQTLYSALVPCPKVADLGRLTSLLADELQRTLDANDMHVELGLWDFDSPPMYAKTNNRSVLGSMNDFLFILDYIDFDLVNDRSRAQIVAQQLNQSPMSYLKTDSADRRLAAWRIPDVH